MEVLLLAIGSRTCALPLGEVAEVMRALPLRVQAGLPEGVIGSAVVRGAPVPVVDGGLLLEGVRSSGARLLLLKVNQRRVALAVDRIVGTRRLGQDATEPTPALLQAPSAVVTALGMIDAELVHVLDALRLAPTLTSATDPDISEKTARGHGAKR